LGFFARTHPGAVARTIPLRIVAEFEADLVRMRMRETRPAPPLDEYLAPKSAGVVVEAGDEMARYGGHEIMKVEEDVAGRPVLTLFCGLPGSGKTTLARRLAGQSGAIRFSTDEWMADLGVDPFDAIRDRLQMRLDHLWRELLAHGQSMILEDGTWKRAERDEIRRIATSADAITEMHYFDIRISELWRRLELRNADLPYGTAQITIDVLEQSVRRFERPDEAELSLFDRRIIHYG
jgi:hypothetical protein